MKKVKIEKKIVLIWECPNCKCQWEADKTKKILVCEGCLEEYQGRFPV